MKLNIFLGVCILFLGLSGCSDETDSSLTDGTQNSAAGINDASTSGVDNSAGVSGSQFGDSGYGYGPGGYGSGNSRLGPEFSDPNNPLSKSTIYFMLDSSQIQQDFIPVIAAHAQYLLAHPAQRLALEGHCDERGSREYNIALGEQRAKSVADLMRAQGVSDSQMEIVSYGEEKPAAYGSDESSWEQNRRVELVYK